jgi:hypothetical protein
VCDSSLSTLGNKVEDCGACSFRSSSSRGWYCNQRLQLLVDWATFTQWSVHEVEKLCIRVAGIKIHQFCSVDNRSTPNSEESIRLIRLDKINGLFDTVQVCQYDIGAEAIRKYLRAIFRLHPALIKDCILNALFGQSFLNLFHSIQMSDCTVSNNTNSLYTHVPEIHAHFLGDPRAKSNSGRSHFKSIFLLSS